MKKELFDVLIRYDGDLYRLTEVPWGYSPCGNCELNKPCDRDVRFRAVCKAFDNNDEEREFNFKKEVSNGR
jgi:hypothetical protein